VQANGNSHTGISRRVSPRVQFGSVRALNLKNFSCDARVCVVNVTYVIVYVNRGRIAATAQIDPSNSPGGVIVRLTD